MHIRRLTLIGMMAILVVACGSSNGPSSISSAPSDKTTPTTGVTVSIGPCTSSQTCPFGTEPSIFVLVDPHQGGRCDTAFACQGALCPSCSWNMTFLNQSISATGSKETQFVFQSNQQGNYEVDVQMPAGASAFYLKFSGRGQGLLYPLSVTPIDAPNWHTGCGSQFPNATFWKDAGTPAQTARFLINARAEQDGQPRCE